MKVMEELVTSIFRVNPESEESVGSYRQVARRWSFRSTGTDWLSP
jgi:hypothetical protein